jgi:hypothetical protein
MPSNARWADQPLLQRSRKTTVEKERIEAKVAMPDCAWRNPPAM